VVLAPRHRRAPWPAHRSLNPHQNRIRKPGTNLINQRKKISYPQDIRGGRVGVPLKPKIPHTRATRCKTHFLRADNKIGITPLSGESSPYGEKEMIILLIVLILLFGFGGYRMGPGMGYYGGGGLSLILLIVLIVLLLR
jgi:Protein of unknown function (DUF3309)